LKRFSPFLSWTPGGLLFGLALLVRLEGLSLPPLDFNPTRQYHSALLARRLYLEGAPGVPGWRRYLAEVNRLPRYEPPIMEHAAALAYRRAGGEDLRIPRMHSIIAWLIGGGFVYAFGRAVAGTTGALVAASFFLLSPFTVEASRSFQPDPLMVALLAAAFLGSVRYGERPGLGTLLPAALAGGLAILVKPVALFQVVATFAAVVAFRRHELRLRWLLHAFVFVVVLGLAAPYYYAQRGAFGSFAGQTFMPHLLVTRDFWIGWVGQVWKTCGLAPAAMAAAGLYLLRDGLSRATLAGMAAGYVCFVLVFTYQASTHDYYHLQLFPLVAVGLGVLADRLVAIARCSPSAPRLAIPVAAVLLAVACVEAAITARSRIRSRNFSREVQMYREIGRRVSHGDANVLLADHYAYPLKYHGELGGVEWPRWYDFRLMRLMGGSPRGAADRLQPILDGYRPAFFVITVPGDLADQPDLAALLQRRFPLYATGEGYLIYSLR
jgi:hypothetical protein